MQIQMKLGITVIGRRDDMYYVLECITGKWTPSEWANKVLSLKQTYSDAKVIAEANQGGDLIVETLRHVNILNVELVHATKSKVLRVEDIKYLYEQGKVKHVKVFEQLEYEMLTYSRRYKTKIP